MINTGSNTLTPNVTSELIIPNNVPTLATLPSPATPAGTPAGAVITTPGSTTSSAGSTSVRQTPASSSSSQSNGGTCIHCNKTFRQLRSHIQDVHCPTPTPCPLCGKMFSSKHKMFGHKYRSCPNRTRNLVRHLQDLDHLQQVPQQQDQNNEQQQQQPF